MSLNKVVEEILRKGEEKKQEIIRHGEQESDEQVQQVEKRIIDERQKAEKRTVSMISQMAQQELSSAELESKKAMLGAQRQVMEDLKQQVLHELEGYPADKRKKLYSKLVSKAKKDLGECAVYSNKDDKALLQLPPSMNYAGAIECRGGLMFESKDKSFRLDYRFESMLDDVWNKDIQEIYAKLFR
jgi:V/A-type H+-transporting ATPase subunit E